MPSIVNRIRHFFNFLYEPTPPHNSIEVHRVLITIYRIHLINLFLSLPALLLHCVVLSYSIFKEKACDKPFITWLIIVTSISSARIIPQCIIISKSSTLLAEWPHRPVALDTSNLVKSFIAHLDRILWVSSIVWFFVGFEWAYRSISCNILAPILYQYVTILILFFLAMLGMNCLLCMGSSTLLFLACILPSDRFVHLFEENRQNNYPMPPDLIKQMPIIKWSTSMKEESEISKMCPICISDYEIGHKLRQLPCGHWFHQSCIDQWFKNNSTCPLRCYIDLSSAKFKSRIFPDIIETNNFPVEMSLISNNSSTIENPDVTNNQLNELDSMDYSTTLAILTYAPRSSNNINENNSVLVIPRSVSNSSISSVNTPSFQILDPLNRADTQNSLNS